MEFRIIMWLFIASAWTILITISLINEYRLARKMDWFSLRGRKFAYFCNILTHVTLGFIIWSVELCPLNFQWFMTFMIIGIGFFGLSQAFWNISHNDLGRKLLKKTSLEKEYVPETKRDSQ